MTEDEEKGQKPQSTADPGAELFQRGFHVFMGEVSMETMNPIINWIVAANFAKEKKHKELTQEYVRLVVILMRVLHYLM